MAPRNNQRQALKGAVLIRDALDAVLEPSKVLGTPVDVLLVLVQIAPGSLQHPTLDLHRMGDNLEMHF